MRKIAVWLASLTAAAVVGGLGYWVVEHRLELFELPRMMDEIVAYVATLEDVPDIGPPPRGDGRLTRMLNRLIKLQRPDFEGGDCFRFWNVMTEEGDTAWVVAYQEARWNFETEKAEWSHGVETRYDALDTGGVLLGETFVIPWVNDHQLFLEPPGGGRGPDVLRTDEFEFSVDWRGIVPRGFVIIDNFQTPLATAVAASANSSEYAREFLEADLEELPANDQVTRLLRSRHPGDLFRALHQLEHLGPNHAGRALVLLEHQVDFLRARAAAVVANDPAQATHLLPLREDPSPRVRIATHVGLLHADRTEIARESFLFLLKQAPDALCNATVDVSRLSSESVADAILDGLEKQVSGTGKAVLCLDRLLDGVSGRDLLPFTARLEALWETTGGRSMYRREAVLRALVRLEDDRSGEFLGTILRRHAAGGFSTLEEQQLLTSFAAASLERDRPIRAAVEIFTEICQGERRDEYDSGQPEATLALCRWKDARRVEWALAWLDEAAPDAPLIDGETYEELELWVDYFPSELVRPVLQGLPGIRVDASHFFVGLLARRPAAVSDDSVQELIAVWRRILESGNALGCAVELLVRVGHPDLDRELASAFADSAPDSLLFDSALWALRERTAPPEDPRFIAVLDRMASGPSRVSRGARERRKRWKESAGGTIEFLPAADAPEDRSLEALLLLAHWQVRGAGDRLLARVRVPQDDSLFSPLWEGFVPSGFDVHLRALASEQPARCAERVQWLLAGEKERRKMEEAWETIDPVWDF